MMNVTVKIPTVVPKVGAESYEKAGPDIEVRNDYSDGKGEKIIITTPDGKGYKVEAELMRQAVDRCAGVRWL